MTPDAFRKLALALSDVSEGAHMGHADFRAGRRVFATLGHPDAEHAMVKLSLGEQALRLEAPEVFTPAAGAGGRQGSTLVILADADAAAVRGALVCAHAAAVAKPPPRPRRR